MQRLREFAQALEVEYRDDWIEAFAPRAVAPVVGVQVGYDRRWLWLYSLWVSMGSKFHGVDGTLEAFDPEYGVLEVPGEIDDTWYPHSWLDWNGGEKRSPFVVRYLHESEDDEGAPRQYARPGVLREEDIPERSGQLVDTGEGVVAVIHELRPPTEPQSSVKATRLWQQPGNVGTAGGIIHFAKLGDTVTTAGHVAPTLGALVTSDRGGRTHTVGPCVHVPDYSAAGLIDETALIGLTGTDGWHRPAKVARAMTASDVGVGQRVGIVGASSAHGDLYPNEYIRYRTLGRPPGAFRIDDGFELRRRTNGFFGNGAFGQPTEPGDSGAWIVADRASGPEWCGTLVGGDSVSSVATFATNTLDVLSGLYGAATLT